MIHGFYLIPAWKMGIYLSSPKTEKASDDGENDRLRYGLSSMQGWRATMEDAVSLLSIITVPLDVEFVILFSQLFIMRPIAYCEPCKLLTHRMNYFGLYYLKEVEMYAC